MINEYSFEIYIDGEDAESVLNGNAEGDEYYFTEDNLIRSNTEGIGGTGDGVLTEVYVDNAENARDVTIAIINTYLAKAVDDYDERNEEATFEVWSVEDVNSSSTITQLVKNTDDMTTDLTVSNDDFDVTGVQEDDIVLVRVADGEIQEMIDPQVLSEVEITSFRRGYWVTADGTQYDYADSIQYDPDVLDAYDDHNMKDTTYNVYLDPYGYAIGVEIVEDADQYLFLTGIDSNSSNLGSRNLEGNVILMDGTMDTVTINVSDSDFITKNFNAIMNTWCEYTVDKNGVYTLTEVANTAGTFVSASGEYDKVGQSSNQDALMNQFSTYSSSHADTDMVILDKSHVTLNGIASTGFQRVYANDNTVFLTVDTKAINAKSVPHAGTNTYAVIVDDVVSVATGIQNVNLNAWNSYSVVDDISTSDFANKNDIYLANVSHGVYTLFDDDGYVIAAVVVGEDQGSTTSYAYVTSSNMNREAYDAAADEYTWTREVVVNGEVVTLTEIGSSNPEIGTMNRGEWYEVRYDADGNVRRVDRISTDADVTGISMPAVDFGHYYTEGGATPDDNWTGDKYIQDIRDVEDATNDENVVLLWDNLLDQNYSVSVVGSTLQIDTASGDHMGFAVRSDAKTVLIQDSETSSGRVTYMDDIYEYTGGNDGLRRAVRNLNDNNNFIGFVGAVFENGVATSIVIYDKTATDINTGVPGGSASGIYVDLTNPGSVIVNTERYTLSENDAVNAIEQSLANAGWTVESISEVSANVWEFDVVNGNRTNTYRFTYPSGVNLAAASYTLDGQSRIGRTYTPAANSYARYSTDGGRTWTYTSTAITIQAGMRIETGYVKLAVTGSANDLSGVVYDGSSTYYVKADTVVTKVSGANGTGFKVGSTYYAYNSGVTYGWIDANDGTNDGTATLTVAQVKLTIVNGGVETVSARAYNATPVAANTLGAVGPNVRVGSASAPLQAVASAMVTLNRDVIIYDNAT